ncbi:MAG: FKBP-type peptidyl-prolyl cis-trans isomerase [bacterium]|nr:FKBP-type peptidyl-prolyl cis-trans isomerase [bacterium]
MRIAPYIALLFLISCRQKPAKITFSKDRLGYYYHLIAFANDSSHYMADRIARVSAEFKTQRDSVFWDSHNNMSSKFFIRVDSGEKRNFLQNYVSKLSEGDSACLLIKPSDFFVQQFNSEKVPYFSLHDSVVRVNLKVERIYTVQTFQKVNDNLRVLETQQIENHFKDAREFEMARDEAGFFWLDRPAPSRGESVKMGEEIKVVYRGQFMNGRYLESSAQQLEFIYGSPDQLLKGLNIVIGKLKLGQNAKIILPSRLAFGELGSSNGTVPPFTPLMYSIRVFQERKDAMNQ